MDRNGEGRYPDDEQRTAKIFVTNMDGNVQI
jgi:hypothetical protein